MMVLMSDEGEQQFNEEVFPAEWRDICARRAAMRGDAATAKEEVHPPPGLPSTRHGLVGLALSGGGIRSASFSLGVLQALQAHKILPEVDYLSTVSGGGWIGSCLSALMRTPGQPFPFTASPNNRVLEFLRDRSSALVPSGVGGGLGVVALALRGMLASVVMVLVTMLLPSIGIGIVTTLWALILRFSRSLRSPVDYVVITPLLFLAGLAVLAGTLVVASFLQRDSRIQRWIDALPGWIVKTIGVAFLFELHVCFASNLTVDAAHLAAWSRLVVTPGGLACVGVLVTLGALASALPVIRAVALLLIGVANVALIYIVTLGISAYFFEVAEHGTLAPTRVIVAGLLSVFLLFVLIDTNNTSLHGIFRRQIAGLFLLRRVETRCEPEVAVPLSSLSQPGSLAPYHLLNTALNLQGSKDSSLRGRRSDFFVLSKHYFGGHRTGYCATRLWEKTSRGVDLSTAMAVSAAAASPNMGTYTLAPVVMLMAMLNIRLGFWMPSPSKLRAWAKRRKITQDAAAPGGLRSAWWAVWWAPSGLCYLRELRSRLDEHRRHVYLTDGGHLENTGAYELLRRRCRFVIVCDAEEDGSMHFGGLSALVRFARLDLGVEIEVDLDDLLPREGGVSRRHVVVGRIRYPAREGEGPEYGQLLYLKSSVTGDEHPLIRQFRAGNPNFPHDSTANQTFGEAQFEAYRALGEHSAQGLFASAIEPAGGADRVASWFTALEARVSHDPLHETRFPALRDELEEVETLLRAPEVAGYFAELYPELVDGRTSMPVPATALHEVGMRQLHLIASAFTQLRLDEPGAIERPRNRGWIQVFRRWAASPSFQRVWLVGAVGHGPWFRQFCQDAMGLECSVVWAKATPDEVASSGISLEVSLTAVGTEERVYLGRLDTRRVVGRPVMAARVEVRTEGGRRAAVRHVVAGRPGYDDLMESEEARAALDRALAESSAAPSA